MGNGKWQKSLHVAEKNVVTIWSNRLSKFANSYFCSGAKTIVRKSCRSLNIVRNEYIPIYLQKSASIQPRTSPLDLGTWVLPSTFYLAWIPFFTTHPVCPRHCLLWPVLHTPMLRRCSTSIVWERKFLKAPVEVNQRDTATFVTSAFMASAEHLLASHWTFFWTRVVFASTVWAHEHIIVNLQSMTFFDR